MADTKNILFLAAAGGAAWWFFFRNPAPVVAVHPTVPAGTAPPATTPPAGGTGTGTAPPANTLAGIYAKMVTASGLSADARLGADGWGYYLNQVINPLGYTAPDPLSVFGVMLMGQDRSAQFTAAEYWAVMGPAIRTATGLSGLGWFGGRGVGVVQ